MTAIHFVQWDFRHCKNSIHFEIVGQTAFLNLRSLISKVVSAAKDEAFFKTHDFLNGILDILATNQTFLKDVIVKL